jgi:hypothetical protein
MDMAGDFSVTDTLTNTSIAKLAIGSAVGTPPEAPIQGIMADVVYPLAGAQLHSSIFVGDTSALGGPSRLAGLEWMNYSSTPTQAAARVLATYSDANNGELSLQAADNNNNASIINMSPAAASIQTAALTLNSTAPVVLTGYAANAHPVSGAYSILVVDASNNVASIPGNVIAGLYIPSNTNLANLSNVSTSKSIYSQCGSLVHANLSFQVTPITGVAPISFHTSLPVALSSGFTDGFSANGIGIFGTPTIATTIGATTASITSTQTVLIEVSAPGTTSVSNLNVVFDYLVF